MNHSNSGIYVWLKDDEVVYVGQSINLSQRRKDYYKQSNKCLVSKAIRKYGDRMIFKVVCYCGHQNLLKMEQHHYFLYSPRYNKMFPSKNPNDSLEVRLQKSKVSLENDKSLTEAIVIEIRKRKFEGEQKKEVYKDYDIGYRSFTRIWEFKVYKHLGVDYKTSKVNRGNMKGSANPNSKLSDDDRVYIVQSFNDGVRAVDLARKFRVNKTTIYDCLKTCRD